MSLSATSLACTVLLLLLCFIYCSNLKLKKIVVCQRIDITFEFKQLWQLQFILLIFANVKADKESSNSNTLVVLSWEELQQIRWSGWRRPG